MLALISNQNNHWKLKHVKHTVRNSACECYKMKRSVEHRVSLIINRCTLIENEGIELISTKTKYPYDKVYTLRLVWYCRDVYLHDSVSRNCQLQSGQVLGFVPRVPPVPFFQNRRWFQIRTVSARGWFCDFDDSPGGDSGHIYRVRVLHSYL